MSGIREPSNADIYMAYMRGWHCGAGIRAIDPKLSEHENDRIREEYLNGWAVGRKCAREAEKMYGYSPSVLRAIDVNPTSPEEDRIAGILRHSREVIQPLIDESRKGEQITSELMNTILR